MAEYLLKGGEIPKAIKQKESRGRINLWDIDIIRFRRSQCLPLFKEHEAHLCVVSNKTDRYDSYWERFKLGQLVQPSGIAAVVRVETLLCSSGDPDIYDCQVPHNKT